jgi:hypothetical protein
VDLDSTPYYANKKKIANRSFENVADLKHLGTAVTNRNLIQEE